MPRWDGGITSDGNEVWFVNPKYALSNLSFNTSLTWRRGRDSLRPDVLMGDVVINARLGKFTLAAEVNSGGIITHKLQNWTLGSIWAQVNVPLFSHTKTFIAVVGEIGYEQVTTGGFAYAFSNQLFPEANQTIKGSVLATVRVEPNFMSGLAILLSTTLDAERSTNEISEQQYGLWVTIKIKTP